MEDMRPQIRAEMERRQWSQHELARQAGINVQDVNRYLAGRQLGDRKFLAVLYALGFRVEKNITET